jgi:predicted Zn-dependent peptidase
LSAYVEGEKHNQCDAIEAQINNPRAYASKRCREIMFEGDAYGVSLLGTTDFVESITDEELSKRYRQMISEYRYEFFYIGPRSLEEVERRLAEVFLSDVKSNAPCKVIQTAAKKRSGEVRRVTEEMPLAQGKLVLGFLTGAQIQSEDFYATLVMNEIYGGSPVSKLFMNVRERLGLCYYCSSHYDIFKGAMFVSCGISPENRENAEGEILAQLADIQAGNVSEEEFEAAKHSLCNSYLALSDSPALLEGYYFCRNEFGVDCSIEKCMEKIKAVKLSDVIRVAANVSLDTVYFLNGNGEEDEDVGD